MTWLFVNAGKCMHCSNFFIIGHILRFSFFRSHRPYASDLYDLVDCYFDAKDEAERTELEARLSMVEDNIIKNFIFEEGKTERNDLSRVSFYFLII